MHPVPSELSIISNTYDLVSLIISHRMPTAIKAFARYLCSRYQSRRFPSSPSDVRLYDLQKCVPISCRHVAMIHVRSNTISRECGKCSVPFPVLQLHYQRGDGFKIVLDPIVSPARSQWTRSSRSSITATIPHGSRVLGVRTGSLVTVLTHSG